MVKVASQGELDALLKKMVAESGTLQDLKAVVENTGYSWPKEFTQWAAAAGNLDFLKYAHETGCPWHKYTTSAAAEGHLDCLKYAHENGCPWSEGTTREAARGHFDCLKYAHENQCPWSEDTTYYAAQGHLDCLKYAHENGCPWSEGTTREAARGHLDCLKYAHENECPWAYSSTTKAAQGHLDCLKYAHENQCPWSEDTTYYAAQGHLDCLKYAHENQCPWHEDTTSAAAEGHLDCLKYAHENGCPWSEGTTREAAKGHLDCLKYAHENQCPWHEDTTSAAAEGHLNCLKYAHENGCPWAEYTTTFAAQGHLDCLKYAHENQCPWHEHTTLVAAAGHLDCLKYAHENGCPWGEDDDNDVGTMSVAAEGHLDCLKYAHENECPWHEDTTREAARGHLDCLKYAHENECPWSEYTTSAAAEGHLDCLKYAHENQCPWAKDTTREAAQGHLDCLKYAHENQCPWSEDTTREAARGHLDCLKYAHENGCPWHKDTMSNAKSYPDCFRYADDHGAPMWEGAHEDEMWRKNLFGTLSLTNRLRSSTKAGKTDWLYNLSMDVTTEWTPSNSLYRRETYLFRSTPTAVAVYGKWQSREFAFKVDDASAPILVNHDRFIFSRSDTTGYRVYTSRITEGGAGPPVPICHDKSTKFEKNWGPFDVRADGSFRVVYSVTPLRVFRFEPGKPACYEEPVVSATRDNLTRISSEFALPFRGGTRGVPFYDEFLFVGHTTQHRSDFDRKCFPDFVTSYNRDDNSDDAFRREAYPRMYYAFFYTIRRDGTGWRLSRMSACFQPTVHGVLNGLMFPKVVFPVGLVLEGDEVTVSYGVNDQHCLASTYPREYVHFLLKDVDAWNENNYVAHPSFERYFRRVQYHRTFLTRSPVATMALATGKSATTSVGRRDALGTSAPGTGAFNPAIAPSSPGSDVFVLAARRVEGNVRSWAGRNVVILAACRFTFDADGMHYHQVGPYETIEVSAGTHVARGEDPRLVTDGSCTTLLFNDVEDGKRRMYLHDLNSGDVSALCHAQSGDFEKNWGPFFHEGVMHVVHTVHPLKILRAPTTKCRAGACAPAHCFAMKELDDISRIHGITFRGGTPGIPYGDGEYLFVGHGFHDAKRHCFSQQVVQRATKNEQDEPEWHSAYPKMYWIFFYTVRVDHPRHPVWWKLNRISACSHLPGKRQNFTKIVFPCGLAEMNVPGWKSKGYLISYGEKDMYSDFCVVSREFLEFVLRKQHTAEDYVCDVNLFNAVLAMEPDFYVPPGR